MTLQATSPLEKFVLDALNEEGFAKMREEDQKMMFPQFVAEAERRLGIVMAPLVTEEMAGDFKKMIESEADAGKWYAFWKQNVPNFEKLIKKAMQDFAKEIGAAIKS